MIELILGGVGSGKTLTAIKVIKTSSYPCFTNFATKKLSAHRLKIEDIIIKNAVNWEFWKKQLKEKKNFHIILDELHNIMHSRRSMSKFNILMSTWVAQIRKICGSSEKTHLYCISQELERVDIAVRDLTNHIIYCEKKKLQKMPTYVYENSKCVIKMIPQTWIFCSHFTGSRASQRYAYFRDGMAKADFTTYFLGNDYMRYYDSYDLVEFGSEGYL